MKTTVYLRVGKGKGTAVKHAVTTWPTQKPLLDSQGRVLPTTAFAIALDIPDEAFESAARVVAELKVPEEKLTIAAEVLEIEAPDAH